MVFGAQKAIVPEVDLPPFTVFEDNTFGYRLRYRIVSSDRNRFSPYSSIYTVRPNYVFERPASKPIDEIAAIRIGPYVNIVWDAVSIRDRVTGQLIKRANQYDVWLNWSKGETNAEWVLADRAEGNLQGAVVPSSYTLVDGTVVSDQPTRLGVEVYIRTTAPTRASAALLVYNKLNIDISVPIGPPPN